MEKILLIEDEQHLSNNLKILLEGSGYKVFQAMNGTEGIGLIKEKKPDLIISDIMMPGVDGYEVLKTISRDINTNSIPFVFLTAKADMENLRAGMQMGADDYLIKPVKAQDLLDTVKVRLHRYKSLVNRKEKNYSVEHHGSHPDMLMLKTGNRLQLVNKKEIICIEACGESSRAYLTNGRKIIICKLLKDWESILPKQDFIRIHRSTIININYTERFEPWFKRSLKIYLKEVNKSFIVSKRNASRLKGQISF